LHLHPYYEDTFGWTPDACPRATALWARLVSLPIFPGMQMWEIDHVVSVVTDLCRRHSRSPVAPLGGGA
jgi:perosamine synthetase